MRDLKINILNEDGQLMGFLIDREIMSGLYITFDYNKVAQNYESFKINYQKPRKSELNSVVFNMDDITVISTQLDADNHVQFLFEENLSLKKLRKVPENIIPSSFKKIIRSAYKTFCEKEFITGVAS
ncbi:MAG: hypothetical protein CMP76_05920 [Flavobacterium sp.]|uniref:Uncharacterized protein n=1 Tax=Flavobacterium profundi TaxID=1774945 RepID=A0A6I4IUE8_9FLAO|nr:MULTISPECIES: hypothetical protein [Flavobacterium]MBF02816.1 hypothetical protein [Flavobacterium sp.]MCO6162851.1 hypothetical protein [Flavobacterium sp. NRK F7]MVO10503.1 hypothetical protein [Flavobacterium profundi]|tara:strand:+ start:870 stop:1250 length:381 start_codon:yes stop_codon:yes gene_type:complete